ncbi:MAG: NAD(P)-dependent oxidoreductase [Cyclobacteriaceae bacterium]|nr:NAD(P)-dependent oxidoreductase [Cyclobacteriaceae bacterium]
MQITNEIELEDVLSTPSKELIKDIGNLKGDFLFLGVAGKMGISMAKMLKRAIDAAEGNNKIIGVARFSLPEQQDYLEQSGILTMKGDLMDQNFLKSLPDAAHVFYLAGQKFGTEGNESLTWAMNSYLPGLIAERFKNANIVAFSTGCVYPLVPVTTTGSKETDDADPIGEYAQSCLGRERLFEFGSKKYGTKVILIRLYYSVETRYGVLVDIASKVKSGLPIDVTMGYANVIWQTDANDMILRSLKYCNSPAEILNIAGTEVFSIREVAQKFANIMGKKVEFTGTESETALLGDGALSYARLGKPKVNLNQMIEWTASWMMDNGKTLGKPTHFEARDGKY